MKMKMTKKKWILLAICAALAIGVGSCYAKAAKIKPTLQTIALARGEMVSQLTLSGNVSNKAVDEYILSGNSEVAAVFVKNGDTVHTGDLLVQFDHTDAMNTYKKAAIAYESKRLQLDETQRRYFDLQEDIQDQKDDIEWFKKKKDEYEDSIDLEEIAKYESYYTRWKAAKDTLDALENNVLSDEAIKIEQLAFEQAKMAMDEAERAVNRLPKDIVALSDGVVDSVMVSQYNTAVRGTKAVTVRVANVNTVDFKISRFDVAKLTVDQVATVTVGGKEYTGVVTSIDPVAAADSNLGATVTLDNAEGIIPGMDADLVIVTYEADDVLMLPLDATKTDRVGDYCYIVTPIEGDTDGLYAPSKVYITAGNLSDAYIEVLDGLEEGAQVVINPPTQIDSYTAVNILPQ